MSWAECGHVEDDIFEQIRSRSERHVRTNLDH